MSTISRILGLLFISNIAFAQKGQLPQVYFPKGATVCDTTPWQLVFEDQFDGKSLKAPWITFKSWKSMPGGDHENWGEGRWGTQGEVSYVKDENVVVSDGTVKLLVIKERASWKCDTCQAVKTADYTTGYLRLPYTRSFNAGKFEAAIKMPDFMHAHATFWTWWGQGLMPGTDGSQGVNEIDIAEAYGKRGPGLFGDFPYVNHSLHAWEPGDNKTTNPYDVKHVELRGRYPRQTWKDWTTGRFFKINEWHTYTCEWDTAVVRFFVDGRLVSENWKYLQYKPYRRIFWPFTKYYLPVPSGCNPPEGLWSVLQGFPYNNQSESALNFTPGVDAPHPSQSGFLGQMEIDYVRIWQRHPKGN
jgi:beta-glucanase (GH16 family)